MISFTVNIHQTDAGLSVKCKANGMATTLESDFANAVREAVKQLAELTARKLGANMCGQQNPPVMPSEGGRN